MAMYPFILRLYFILLYFVLFYFNFTLISSSFFQLLWLGTLCYLWISTYDY